MNKVLGVLGIGLFSLTATPAEAGGVYMGGGGPKLGTMILPGKYPLGFPSRVSGGKFDNCSTDGDDKVEGGQDLNNNGCLDLAGGDRNGGTPNAPTIQKVGFDLAIGGQGVYYADKSIRIGGMGHIGFGSKFSDAQVLGFVDQVLKQASVDFYVGGGIGIGQYTFRGEGDTERLRVPYYPLRAHTGFQIRQPKDGLAFSGTAYALIGLPGNHVYVNPAGNEFDDVKAPASYITAGLEFSTMFGDFKPPKKKKKRRGKGKR